MKLKPIVAAMALLVSGSAFGAYQVPHAKINNIQPMLDRNANPYYVEHDWFKRICLSGLIQADAMVSGRNNTLVPFPASEKGSSDIWLSRANLYIDAAVNSWVYVHAAFSTFSQRAELTNASAGTTVYGRYDPASYRIDSLVDEAYVMFGNAAESSFYGRFGREYVRYGDYKRNVNPATLTQLMTQSQGDVAEIGILDLSGFNASGYFTRTAARVGSNRTDINNGGIQVGYAMDNGDWGFDTSLDWMYDILGGVNYIRKGTAVGISTSTREIGGLSFEAKGHWAGFDATAQYTTALRKLGTTNGTWGSVTNGAEPYAWMVDVGYTFNVWDLDSRIGISYQRTGEALALLLPQYRVQGDIDVEVMKNTSVGLHIIYDEDYDNGATATAGSNIFGTPVAVLNGNGGTGTGRGTTTGLVDLTVRFA